MVPVEKNKEYIVTVIDNGYEGEGIAKIDNFTVFVPNAIKGEKARIVIVKVTTSHAFGKIIEILEKSPKRILEDCSTYKRCGGCQLRHIEYEETLNMKQQMVQNLVNKELKQTVQVEKTIGMGNPYHYRNKAQYPVGINKEGKVVIGVYANRTHEIIPIQGCFIQKPITEEIAQFICQYIQENAISIYDEKTGKGIFRHLVFKVGMQTEQVMCILVINSDTFEKEKELIKALVQKFPCIKTIIKNSNKRNTNVILGEKNVTLYGNGYIYDVLGSYKFKISPLSFYQTNPVQTELLYNLAIEKSKIQNKDIVFDLYCGIGTIGIFASSVAQKVYGIEIVEQAIQDAKENARINAISNIEFLAGDVERLYAELIKQKDIHPNIVFVDPPRKGLDNATIQNIMEQKVKKIVYISCNSATLVRDLKQLEEKYVIKEIQPVDMFPFTTHVECVAVLQLK